ncbi:putative permease [Clostridium pasteurianum DSM 525 = ATCC 6013]|uniref:Auxin Efflux Carrier n=1 Tax=Clostridium pasteurianum DSM 525 = ATCC 6013 TaxID=1262449 RepID=A0A0H3J4M7_CLOPA|nr:AEC family transporter [Clostridium pasteurianum]AJA48444.1 putative permease [Clostridium pasteurianum DSM 525 = ATCC 6013]AJA52432.1 putative permease [Clostridium pasteurianum DSM 525 = ATCC 6013]AOZ75688.1 malonate transporter [Clostridium pasteurianum DSM 525 = ATCC 6013]AOZ79484.1 malonate transporter [Clostridium pasteurianum]ELP60406.1 auxin efflux carrier (AEC) family transporter protein [Clostridium pasteurianum DSM 525 = ATCC 6013]
MNNINNQFIISMFIIILGYVCKRFNIVKEKDGEGLARIVINITLPCLIISTFSTLKVEYSLIKLTLISVAYGILMTVVGMYLFRKKRKKTKGILLMLLPTFNIGLFAYPLVQAIWGHEGVKYFAMFDVGNSFIIFVLCHIIASYYSKESETLDIKSAIFKAFKSIPLITYIIVVVINILGISIPKMIIDFSGIISKANMPMSLILLGIYLSFKFDFKNFKDIISILALRYIIGFSVGLLFFIFSPFDKMTKYTLFVGFILPIASTIIPFSIEFNYDAKLVGVLSNMTILISFILVWILVGITT